MTATTHALIGGIVASTVSNQPLGLTISFVTHPLLDMVPHWDFGVGWKKKTKVLLLIESLGDLFLGTILAFIFFYNPSINIWYFLACILLSTGWDIVCGPYLLFNWKFFPFNKYYQFKSMIQRNTGWPWGILNQVITVILFILVLGNLNL